MAFSLQFLKRSLSFKQIKSLWISWCFHYGYQYGFDPHLGGTTAISRLERELSP